MNLNIPLLGTVPQKFSNRLFPKVCIPLKLGEQCLQLLVKQFKRAASQIGRNSKDKKTIRTYLSKNVPECLLQQILDRAVDLYNAEDALDILDMLHPHRFAKTFVDLIGSKRFEIDWFISLLLIKEEFVFEPKLRGFMKNRNQLNRLYNILLWASPAKLEELSIAINSEMVRLGDSNLPNILARAHSLTKLVMPAGADNHVLRIVGLNCPSLRFLDVFISEEVTDQGFQGLLLRRPSRRKAKRVLAIGGETTTSTLEDEKHFDQLVASEKNGCANSLEAFLTFPGNVSRKGIQFICKILTQSYSFNQLACIRVFSVRRMSKMALMEVTPATVEVVKSCTENVITPRLQAFNLEVFKAGDNAKLALCVDDFRAASIMCKIERAQITALVLSTVTIRPPNVYTVNVATLGRSLPNLKYFVGGLECDVIRLEDDNRQYLLPHLQVVNAYLCRDSRVVIFMLKYAPALKSLLILFKREYSGVDDDLRLTNRSVRRCLAEKMEHEKNLEEIMIKPSEHLTIKTLKRFVKCYPKLERIGELDSWNRITQRHIDKFNRHLDAINSQCVVSLVDTAFTKQENREYNNILNFMNY